MTAILTAIQVLFEEYLFTPWEMFRHTHSWWAANIINIIFIFICVAALIYWIGQLKKYDNEGKEDRSSTAHTYL